MIKKFVRDLQYALNSREHNLFNHLLPEEKRERLKRYASRYSNFVETGTYLGETAAAMAAAYRNIHTIEVHEPLFRDAQQRLSSHENVKCYLGDSSKLLPEVIARLEGPAVFWLDAHYSGPKTGRAGKAATPIEDELRAIFKSERNDHLVLIDDARLFVGKNSYPRLGRLWKFVRTNSGYGLTVRDDIIRLYRDPERY